MRPSTWWPGAAFRRNRLRTAWLTRPAPPSVPFAPPDVDLGEARADVDAWARELCESVDEVTGGALDNRVNAIADRWVEDLVTAYGHYRAQAHVPTGAAHGRATLARELWLRDLSRLAEAGTAVEASLIELVAQARVRTGRRDDR